MFEAHELAINYVFWKFKFDGRSERKIKGILRILLKEIRNDNTIVINQ